jgi:2-oxoisovalerate dehydrogenase E2 component (dihydrolipoyl transacylase)
MASVTMPQLGESVVEGTVARWLKSEGDAVAKYEPLVEVITDKVNSEVPSPEAGILSRIAVPEGQTVKVGTEIAVIETAALAGSDEAADRPDAAPAATAPPHADAGAASPAEAPAVVGSSASAGAATDSVAEATDAPKYSTDELRRRSSPLVRRLAQEHDIDLALVTGTGTGGRVTKEDMLAYIEQRQQPEAAPAAAVPAAAGAQEAAPAAAPAAPPPARPPDTPASPAERAPEEAAGVIAAPASREAIPTPARADEVVLPTSPMRRAIAEHMVRSVTTAPHAWTYVEVDASGLVRSREAARAAFREREGIDLSYVPFVCKALVEALREHPVLNSTWREGQVVLKQEINLGVAVALEDGLVVPVIRNADEKSIAGLARTLADLVGRARAGRLGVADVQGGTFTLNNTGALGSVLSMPIINQPQAAILTMEALAKRVVVTADEAIAVRPMLNLCLSFDHRVCDGLQVGRFMQAIRRRIETMTPEQSIY